MNKWWFALGGGVLEFHINNPGVGLVFLVQAPFTPGLQKAVPFGGVRSGNIFTIYLNGVAVGSQTNIISRPESKCPVDHRRRRGVLFLMANWTKYPSTTVPCLPAKSQLSTTPAARASADRPASRRPAAVVVNGFVVGATITDGGYGYTNTPTVRIIGGGGSGAQAVAVVSNGVVTAVNVLDAGFRLHQRAVGRHRTAVYSQSGLEHRAHVLPCPFPISPLAAFINCSSRWRGIGQTSQSASRPRMPSTRRWSREWRAAEITGWRSIRFRPRRSPQHRWSMGLSSARR